MTPQDPASGDDASAAPPPTFPPLPPESSWRQRLVRQYPWIVFVLPMLVFAAFTSLEPVSPAASADTDGRELAQPEEEKPLPAAEDDSTSGWIPYRYYPLIYTLKIVATVLAVIVVWPGYRQFPWRIQPLAIVVGMVGVVVWIGLCRLEVEPVLWEWLGWETLSESGGRSRYNPWVQLEQWPVAAAGFLLVRFLGLVALVPLIEEFFLRGFVMRFVMSDRWWEIPFGKVNTTAVLVGTLVPMMMHPGELLAAAAWFSMITWLMVRTRNIWDCVAAHAVTNLLLGLYAVGFDEWRFL
jgi:uncharacterized protein